MSASPVNKSFFAYPALLALCYLCVSAVKIKTQLRFLGMSWLTCAFFLSSCADKIAETATSPPKTREEARLVGRVASIHKSQNFILIQSYGTWNTQTGAILATVGPDGRAANLKVTGEKIGQFAAADIQSGTLVVGDSVYTTLSVEVIDTPDEEVIETES